MERYVNAVSENGKLKEENETLKYRLEFMNNQANSVNSTFHKALDDARTLKEENEKLKTEIADLELMVKTHKRCVEQADQVSNNQLRYHIEMLERSVYTIRNELKAQLQPTQKTHKCATCRDYKRVMYVGSSWIGKDPFKDCPDCCKENECNLK